MNKCYSNFLLAKQLTILFQLRYRWRLSFCLVIKMQKKTKAVSAGTKKLFVCLFVPSNVNQYRKRREPINNSGLCLAYIYFGLYTQPVYIFFFVWFELSTKLHIISNILHNICFDVTWEIYKVDCAVLTVSYIVQA